MPAVEDGGPPSMELVIPGMEHMKIANTEAEEEEEEESDEHEDRAEASLIAPTMFNNTRVNDEVNDILRQFFPDILAKSPNARNATGGRVIRLSDRQRSFATIAEFQETNLARIFNTARYKMDPHGDQWEYLFNAYFPPKGMSCSPNRQNYRKTVYYPAWQDLTSRLDTDTVDSIRHFIRQTVFKNIFWLPWARADRIWETRPLGKNTKWYECPPQEENLSTPCLVINGKTHPRWEPEAPDNF